MKSFRLKVKKFLEEEAAEEYNGDTLECTSEAQSERCSW